MSDVAGNRKRIVVLGTLASSPYAGPGQGILPFRTLADAVDAVEQLTADPARHAEAALAVADAYFDSDRILARFIDQGRHAWLTAR